MRRIIVTLFGLALLATAALAQDGPYIPLEDDVYFNDYFGTQLIVFRTTQITTDSGWWADALPDALNQDPSYLIGLVNSSRMEREVTPLLDLEQYPISIGPEEETDGGWQYSIAFNDMRPSEVQLILNAVGGAAALFGDGQLSFMPLLTRDYSTYNYDADQALQLVVREHSVVVEQGATLEQIKADVAAMFKEIFGQDVILSIYYNLSLYDDGSTGSGLTVYVTLPAG